MGGNQQVSFRTTPFQAAALTDLNADAYLSAHYELLREDSVRPLREAICHIRREPQQNEDAFRSTVGIYQDVSEPLTEAPRFHL